MTDRFSWDGLGTDEAGLPLHLPMGVTADGQGPTNDDDAHHVACWCGTDCPLNRALSWAFDVGAATSAVRPLLARALSTRGPNYDTDHDDRGNPL